MIWLFHYAHFRQANPLYSWFHPDDIHFFVCFHRIPSMFWLENPGPPDRYPKRCDLPCPVEANCPTLQLGWEPLGTHPTWNKKSGAPVVNTAGRTNAEMLPVFGPL